MARAALADSKNFIIHVFFNDTNVLESCLTELTHTYPIQMQSKLLAGHVGSIETETARMQCL